MVATTAVEVVKPLIVNQQLFSEAYLHDLRAAKTEADAIRACHQTIRDWRETYTTLENYTEKKQYIGQCLSALGLSYSSRQDGFTLYTDETLAQAVGLCLIIEDDDLGRATKGRHHQFRLVQELKRSSLKWGIITNGVRWRLCHAAASAPYEISLEVDLDTLLVERDLTEFGLFYRLFGYGAFAVARTGKDGTGEERTGLDRHVAESEKRTDAIQRHLRGWVEPILQSLCLGFVQDEAAGSYSRETLDAIYKNSIYLLYRILFLFYAEGRELMPVGDPHYQDVSLAAILEDARRRQQEGTQEADQFALWKRLTHLCVIVDDGDEPLGVRPYNGGLFSDTEKPYLKAHKIADAYLAPALFNLGYVQAKSGAQRIDYRDLSVRQLGTLYEGLLEYKLNLVANEPVVVRESGGKRVFIPQSQAGAIKKSETMLEVGQVYFADDKGERKQSGSYYTPEDVVQYIVSNTVGPKIEERCEPLNKLIEDAHRERAIAASEEEREHIELYTDRKLLEAVESELLGLRILDPAMGSAHFLVAAGQMVTNAIVETLNSTEWPNDNISTEPLVWKRRVVERCLYGVDLNPLAQELAKLALWINSASMGKPLTFLDHHLKVGNSLYGAPLSRLSTLPTAKKGPTGDIWQGLREQTIESVLDEVGKITHTDSDRIEDVKYKGEANRTAENFLQRLRDLANVWLATLFGLEGSNGGPVEESEYFQLLEDVTRNYAPESWELKVENTRLLREAREIAHRNRESFFHWELEFPDAVVKGACRFDAIVANPPYVGTLPSKAITTLYETSKCGDLYVWMLERALSLIDRNSAIGMIVPLSLMFGRSLAPIRQAMLSSSLHLHLSCYDNIPDNLFNTGKTSENTNKENSQRTTILFAQSVSTRAQIETTDLLRWRHEDRRALFRSIHVADTTSFASSASFPRIGSPLLVTFWAKMRRMTRTLSDISLEILSETQRPKPNSVFLTVPRTTRYFISATPGAMPRNKVLSVTFAADSDMKLTQALINSNVFFWYYRAFGDGFLLNVELISKFPVPDHTDDSYLELAARLDAVREQCATFKVFRGESIPNYNFNKRMDILLDIDDWIVEHVAPEMDLPRDIFAQYKSNSFLRPLDLSALLTAEDNTEVEE